MWLTSIWVFFSPWPSFKRANQTLSSWLGYISWSMLTSLGVCIWFFPLFDMEISGYEIAMVSTLLMALNGRGSLPWSNVSFSRLRLWFTFISIGIKFIREFFLNNRALIILLSLVAVASYLVPNPSQRLGVIGIGVAFDIILITGQWWKEERRSQSLVTHLLGLVLFLIVKVLFTTNNPIWPTMNHTNGGLNPHGIALAILCLLEVMTRSISFGFYCYYYSARISFLKNYSLLYNRKEERFESNPPPPVSFSSLPFPSLPFFFPFFHRYQTTTTNNNLEQETLDLFLFWLCRGYLPHSSSLYGLFSYFQLGCPRISWPWSATLSLGPPCCCCCCLGTLDLYQSLGFSSPLVDCWLGWIDLAILCPNLLRICRRLNPGSLSFLRLACDC